MPIYAPAAEIYLFLLATLPLPAIPFACAHASSWTGPPDYKGRANGVGRD